MNMSGPEIDAWLNKLTRYILAVEMAVLPACIPILTQESRLVLPAAAIFMLFDCLCMYFCEERKKRLWKILQILQLVLALVDIAIFILTHFVEIESAAEILTYATIVFLWVHSGFCAIEYRKDEPILFFRLIGAFVVAVTVIVVFVAKNLLQQRGVVVF